MALDKETIRLYDRLNRRLAKFDKAGVTNNTIDLVRHELRLFYESISADVSMRNKRIDKFTMSKQLTDEQQQELTAIAQAMDNIKSSNLSYYTAHEGVDERFKKAYETAKGKYQEVTDLQSYIDFVDRARTSEIVHILTEFMDSDQAMRLTYYATKKGITDKQMSKLIQKNYKRFNDGDQLYLFLVGEIDKKYNKKVLDKTIRKRKTGGNKATGRRIKK